MAKTNQTTMVYETLKQKIENGFYTPSESLPETELATEYNVSRNTIKKALLMLEKDAFVTIEQNKGAKVRSYSKNEVLEYLELRIELEGFIARLAVPYATQEILDKLEHTLATMKQHLDHSDLFSYSACNQEFHQIIYDICPNRTATDMLIRLKTQMKKYNGKTILAPDRNVHSFQEHTDIFQAFKKGDAAQAEQCLRKHVFNVRQTFVEYYSLLF